MMADAEPGQAAESEFVLHDECYIQCSMQQHTVKRASLRVAGQVGERSIKYRLQQPLPQGEWS